MLSVRLFSPEDIARIDDLTRITLNESYPSSFFLTIYDHWQEGFLLATDDNKIIGFILGVISGVRQARILMLTVGESYRRTGVAKMLLRALISSCMLSRLDSIILEVRNSNVAAVNLYTQMGFQIVNSLKSYYRDGEDGLRMSLVLQS